MVSVGTTKVVVSRGVDPPPFSLIEHKGLFARLVEELRRASAEFLHDPKGFLGELLKAEGRDARRRRLLYWGLLVAAVLHTALLVIVAIAGWHRFMAPVRVDTVEHPVLIRVPKDVPLDAPEKRQSKGFEDGGGGGGGQNDPKPAIKAPAPRMVPQPQLVAIDSPPAPNPALPVPPTIVGPETTPPPPGPVGDPRSQGTELSGGPGSGGGVGPGKGTGVGPGVGEGSGPGKGTGPGYNISEGEPSGDDKIPALLFNERKPTGFVNFRWLYRPTPVTTPEAQENKVIGVVFLRATFNANGTVSDIEVVMKVDNMTQSAVDSLQRSRFKPATVNGRPITLRKVPIQIAVHY